MFANIRESAAKLTRKVSAIGCDMDGFGMGFASQPPIQILHGSMHTAADATHRHSRFCPPLSDGQRLA
jgi:hypothetical protein